MEQIKKVERLNSDILLPKDIKFLSRCHGKSLQWPRDFKLIYKATRDGDSDENFWDKVDGKGNAFVLVKSANGRRFGGYRKKAFMDFYGTRKDVSAYLF